MAGLCRPGTIFRAGNDALERHQRAISELAATLDVELGHSLTDSLIKLEAAVGIAATAELS